MPSSSRGPTPTLRLLLLMVLAVGLAGLGACLLFAPAFTLGQTTFTGASLRLLSVCALSLAGLALAVLRAWLRGSLDAPPSLHDDYMDMVHYRHAMVERFWPFVVVALAALFLAFLLN